MDYEVLWADNIGDEVVRLVDFEKLEQQNKALRELFASRLADDNGGTIEEAMEYIEDELKEIVGE